jgi:hypothetical protein
MELWGRRLRHDLNREDVRQIVENVTGFFSVLQEWVEPFSANDNGPAAKDENLSASD